MSCIGTCRCGDVGENRGSSLVCYLIISTKAGDDVTVLGDEQKVVHVLQGLVANAVTAAVSTFSFARVVRALFGAALHLRLNQHTTASSSIDHCERVRAHGSPTTCGFLR